MRTLREGCTIVELEDWPGSVAALGVRTLYLLKASYCPAAGNWAKLLRRDGITAASAENSEHSRLQSVEPVLM